MPPPLAHDFGATAEALSVIAARGDHRAAAMAGKLGGTVPEKGTPWEAPVHRAADVKGTLVSFDRASATATFEAGGRRFRIDDKATGKAFAAGVLGAGITKTFFVPEAQADLTVRVGPSGI